MVVPYVGRIFGRSEDNPTQGGDTSRVLRRAGGTTANARQTALGDISDRLHTHPEKAHPPKPCRPDFAFDILEGFGIIRKTIPSSESDGQTDVPGLIQHAADSG